MSKNKQQCRDGYNVKELQPKMTLLILFDPNLCLWMMLCAISFNVRELGESNSINVKNLQKFSIFALKVNNMQLRGEDTKK